LKCMNEQIRNDDVRAELNAISSEPPAPCSDVTMPDGWVIEGR
jgi:hypothetical protein